MKAYTGWLVLLLTSVLSVAQSHESDQGAVEVGPHHRIHRLAADESAPARQVITLGDGMHYWDGEQWSPSDPTFDVADEGFVASRLHYRVRLSPNLGEIGSVRVITPDGQVLESTPVAIGLYDPVTGESAIIGTIADSQGVQVEDGTVVYENAFRGVCANVVYRIERGAFHQDVVITGWLDVVAHGFDPATAQVQIFTEFYAPPKPERLLCPIRVEQDERVRSRMVSPDLVDEVLGFGEFVIGTGRAFTGASGKESGAPVAKAFLTEAERTFMVETTDYRPLQSELESLPDCQLEEASVRKAKLDYAVVPKAHPSGQKFAARRAVPGLIAKVAEEPVKGVVFDYVATIGGTLAGSTTFKGDATYFLTNSVVCNGGAVLEPGVIIKFPTNSNVSLQVRAGLTCKTTGWRPGIFTAGDDDTVGAKLSTSVWSGYTGNINPAGYGNPALWAYYIAPTLSNLRFRYCQEAVRFEGSAAVVTLAHSQLVECIRGIVIAAGGGCAPSLSVKNTLIADTQFPLTVNYAGASSTFTHCTVDGAARLVTASAASVYAYNSVFANIAALNSGTVSFGGNNNGFHQSPTLGSAYLTVTASPFQTVGAGARYLAAGSSFRNVGSTGIDSTLLGEIKSLTTYPPLVLTNTVTTATTLNPQATRDSDDLPDLGFHYLPADYAVGTLAVTNTTLTLTNGVSLIAFGNTGIWLQDGSSLYSEGTAMLRNHLAPFYAIQEGPESWGGGLPADTVLVNPYNLGASPPTAQFRFTDFDGMADGGFHLLSSNAVWTLGSLTLRDCTLNSARLVLSGPASSTLALNNNLFERAAVICRGAPQVAAYNNLFRYGSVATTNSGSGNWIFRDNAFDNTVIADGGTALSAAYNGYIGMGTNRFYPTNTYDKVLTSFNYLSKPLGPFYHLTTSFRNVGSRNADVSGLFHHTTMPTEAKETNSVVDIGYHYIATSSGVPVDSDGDGIPDYLEDRNGDGAFSTGSETDWQTGTTGIDGAAGLQVFTPLK